MAKNIISGVIGAIIGSVLLYFILGIPTEVKKLDQRVARLEGTVETFTALRKDFEQLQNKVTTVQEELSKVVPYEGTSSLAGGNIGSSQKWGSGWIDLGSATDFKKGDHLRLKIGGTARIIKVRLLPQGKSPNLPVGILPGKFVIPDDRVIDVELTENYPRVSQISVHGGPNPWGMFPIGTNNGPATIENAELIHPR